MSLIGSIAKLAKEIGARVLTDGVNILGTAANPIFVSQSSSTIADGSVTTAKLAANAVTGPKTAALTRIFSGVGHNAAGAATATGFKVGDILIFALDMTDASDVTAGFESAVTVNDQIQQSSATNLSAKTIMWVVQRQS